MRRVSMKIVIAIDSFKGSLTSIEAATAIKNSIKNISDADVGIKPLADGGEGTTRALVDGMGGEMISLEVTGPTGEGVNAEYGIVWQKKLAIVEVAEAAGLILLKNKTLQPLSATTFGVGEMIRDAILKGCRKFIIGLGGSATNDGGVGMLMSLGYEFLDEEGKTIKFGLQGLNDIHMINDKKVIPELKECDFLVACDVENSLCGENGAIFVYGPQKGVLQSQKYELDRMMKHYAIKTLEFIGQDFSDKAGAGAAGGLGFAFISFLNGKLQSGIDIVIEAINLEKEVEDATYVVTGEGQLDFQTAMGKAPIGVAKIARKHGAKVIAFAGNVTEDARRCNEEGIDAFFSITPGVITIDEAMDSFNARKNLELAAEQVFRLIL